MVCNALIRYYIAPSHNGDGASILDAYQQAFYNNPRLSPFIDFLSSQASQTAHTTQSTQFLQRQQTLQKQPSPTNQPSITPQKEPYLLYPVLPGSFCSCALCSPLASLSAAVALTQQTPYLAESKFDGVRIQLHRTDDGVRLFGRSGERLRSLEPAVTALLRHTPQRLPRGFILDGELVVSDAAGAVLPFHSVSVLLGKTPKPLQPGTRLRLCLFDLLALDGDRLTELPLEERKRLLEQSFPAGDAASLAAIPYRVLSAPTKEEVAALVAASVKQGCEGLVLKRLGSRYGCGVRNKDWVKLKADYLEEGGDSVDVVVVGAKAGKGQRKDTFGSFLCAVRDKEEQFRPICSVGSGFSKEQLARLAQQLRPLACSREEAGRQGVVLPREVKMDAYFQPRVVLEVKAASVSQSPLYQGVSLRFPRFLRFREDKQAKDVTSLEDLWCVCYL